MRTNTYLGAAIAVLKASGRPMTVPEILEKIEQQSLVQGSAGATPGSTLRAALYRNLGKHPGLRKESEQRNVHAARGSVRWYVETDQAHRPGEHRGRG